MLAFTVFISQPAFGQTYSSKLKPAFKHPASQSSKLDSVVMGTPSKEAVQAYTDSLARNALLNGPGAGLSIGVIKGTDTLVWRGYGEANVELNAPATPSTVYRIGSNTKQFTAAIIMKLVQEGKISLNEPLSTYVPDYNTHGKTVTIRELLTHTSGIPDFFTSPEFRKKLRFDLTPKQELAFSIRDSLDFPPGTHWSYSNTGYYLLGLIIEKITGSSYDRFVQDSLLTPLGLTHTYYGWRQPIIPNRAEGYAIADSVLGIGKLSHPELVNAPPISMKIPLSGGALSSTIGDLIRWTQLLSTGKVVAPSSYKLMSTPHILPNGRNTHYGFGLMIGDLDGHPAIGHAGGINGFQSMLFHYPDDSLTIAVLSNATSVSPVPLEYQIARFIMEGPIKKKSVTEDLIERLRGKYKSLHGPIYTVYSKDGNLMGQPANHKESKLIYLGNTLNGKAVFMPEVNPLDRLFFKLSENQPAQSFMVKHGQLGLEDRLRLFVEFKRIE